MAPCTAISRRPACGPASLPSFRRAASRSPAPISTLPSRCNPMAFELEPVYLVYGLAAASAALFVQAVYLVFFSATSYRSRINRRLRLSKDQPDRESVLVQ